VRQNKLQHFVFPTADYISPVYQWKSS